MVRVDAVYHMPMNSKTPRKGRGKNKKNHAPENTWERHAILGDQRGDGARDRSSSHHERIVVIHAAVVISIGVAHWAGTGHPASEVVANDIGVYTESIAIHCTIVHAHLAEVGRS